MTSFSSKWLHIIFLAYFLSSITDAQQSSNVGVLKDSDGDPIDFLNFVGHFNNMLNISTINSEFVENVEDCQFLCISTSECLSLNFEIISNDEGRHLCQLLSATEYNKSAYFGPSDRFHHFTTIVSNISFSILICIICIFNVMILLVDALWAKR